MVNKDRWSALSMQDRAALIDIYVKSGITDLGEIRKDYNSFGDGGDTESPVDGGEIEASIITPRQSRINKRRMRKELFTKIKSTLESNGDIIQLYKSLSDDQRKRALESIMKFSSAADPKIVKDWFIEEAKKHPLRAIKALDYVITGNGQPVLFEPNRKYAYNGLFGGDYYFDKQTPIDNGIVDAMLYNREINSDIGVQSNKEDFGPEIDYINRVYPNKNVQYIETRPGTNLNQEGIQPTIYYGAQGSFKTSLPKRVINNQGIIIQEGIRNDSTFVRGLDVYDFKPDDYISKWVGDSSMLPVIKQIDEDTNPVAIKTPWVYKDDINDIISSRTGLNDFELNTIDSNKSVYKTQKAFGGKLNKFETGGPINTDYKVVNNINSRDYWFDTPTGKLKYDRAFNDYRKYYDDFFNSLKGTKYNNVYEKYQNLSTPTDIQRFIARENNYDLFSKFNSYQNKLAFNSPDFVNAEKLYNRYSNKDESLIPSDFNLENYKNSINAQGDQVVNYVNSLYNTSRGKRQLERANKYASRKGADNSYFGFNGIKTIEYYPKSVSTSDYTKSVFGNRMGKLRVGTINNNDFNFRNILAHELGHTRNLYNTPGEINSDSPYYGFNYGYIRNRHKKWLSPTIKVNDHDAELAESYSDLMALRYDLYENNIVDGTKRRYRNRDIKNFLNTEEGQKNRYLQQHTNINRVRKALNRVYDDGGTIPSTLPGAMYNPVPEVDPKEELYAKAVPNSPLRPIDDNFSFKEITEDITNSKGYLYNNRDYYKYYKDANNKFYLHNTRYNRDTGVINPDNFTEVPYEEIRGMLGARDYIGGSKRDVGLKVLDKLTGINDYITQLSNTYGISSNVFKQRLINEGLLQMIAEDYNNSGPNEQKSYAWQDWIDNEINGYQSLGLDTFGSHFNKGNLNLRRDITWYPMEIQNEDGTGNTYTSASFNNLYDALEAKAAMIEYFTNIGRQRGLSGTDLEYWVNAAYNMGENNEKLNDMDYVRNKYGFQSFKRGGFFNKRVKTPEGEGLKTFNHPKYNHDEEGYIYQYLIDQGVPHTQASAIMGNIAVESMLDPHISQIGGGGGYGLIQATDQPRKNNFINYDGQPYVFGSKLDPEIQRQLDYIIDKGLNSYTVGEWRKVGRSGARNVRKEFLKETNINKASDLFTRGYLRPGKPHTKRRRSMSSFYDKKYNNPFKIGFLFK